MKRRTQRGKDIVRKGRTKLANLLTSFRWIAGVAASLALAATALFAAAVPDLGESREVGHPSAAEIERRLSGPDAGPGQAREVLEACRSIAARFDGRDTARFLDQYGRAAARSGEPEVAAVMFARGFLLHPSSRWAPSSLLESATLHRHAFDAEATAQRLARRSLATARALAMRDAIAAAEAFLADADAAGPDTAPDGPDEPSRQSPTAPPSNRDQRP